jgi:DNA polymerase III epsilon subunit-like protein
METINKYIFFDLETTSLNLTEAKIVQICYIKGYFLEDKFIEEKIIDTIIKPENYIIPQKTIEIHGISNELANLNGIPFNLMADELLKDIQDVKYIVGHNIISYDIPVLINNLKNNNYQLNLENYIIEDTIKIVMPYTDNKKIKLQDLYTYLFEKNFDGAHNALCDVKATKDCYQKIKFDNPDLLGLYNIVVANGINRKEQLGNTLINFGKFKGYSYKQILNKLWYCEWILENDSTKELKQLKSYILDNSDQVLLNTYEMIMKYGRATEKQLNMIFKFDKEFTNILRKQKIITETLVMDDLYEDNHELGSLYYAFMSDILTYCVLKNNATLRDVKIEKLLEDNIKSKLEQYNIIRASYEKYKDCKANSKDILNLTIGKQLYEGNKTNLSKLHYDKPIMSDNTRKSMLDIAAGILYNVKVIKKISVHKEVRDNIMNINDRIYIDGQLIEIVNYKIENFSYYNMIGLVLCYSLMEEQVDRLVLYDPKEYKIYSMDTSRLTKDIVKW